MDFYVADSVHDYSVFVLVFTADAVLVDGFYVVDAVGVEEILCRGGFT